MTDIEPAEDELIDGERFRQLFRAQNTTDPTTPPEVPRRRDTRPRSAGTPMVMTSPMAALAGLVGGLGLMMYYRKS